MDQLGEWMKFAQMKFAMGDEYTERVFEALGNLDPELRDHVGAQVFGEGWSRRGLLLREKALVALSALIANSRTELLDTHIRILGRLDVMIERTYAAINEMSRLSQKTPPAGLEETLYSLRFSTRVVNMSFTRDHLEGSYRDFLSVRDIALMELVLASADQPQAHYRRDLAADIARAKTAGLDDSDIRDVAFLTMHYAGFPVAMALLDALKRESLGRSGETTELDRKLSS